jgi:hypothetical protein
VYDRTARKHSPAKPIADNTERPELMSDGNYGPFMSLILLRTN